MKFSIRILTGAAAVAGAFTIWQATAPGIKPVAASAASNAPPRMIAGAGRVEPLSEEIKIGSEVDGRLRSVVVEEGQPVRRGEVIAIVENADFVARVELATATLAQQQAALERLLNGSRTEQKAESAAMRREAEAVFENARAERDRKTMLWQAKVIPRAEFEAAEREFGVAQARFDAARERLAMVQDESRPEDIRKASAEVERAKAQIAEAKAMLDKTFIRSPVEGVVLRKKLKDGESVAAGYDTIVTVGNCSRLRVRVDVDENDVARLKVGQTAWVRADAYGDRKFYGKVIRISGILGRKNIRTDEPAERIDQKILETLVELEAGASLPVGLRVDAMIEPK